MIKPILPDNFYNEVNNLLVDVPENTVGIYFLTHNDKVVYVGQSIDIYNRIKQHRADYSKIFDSFYYDECVKVELDEAEKDFIEFHKPPLNHSCNVEYYIGIEKYCNNIGVKYIDIELISIDEDKHYKKSNNDLFFKSGKPKAKAFERLYGLGRDSFKRLIDKHKKALISYALNPTDIQIIDIVFTSASTVEIKYISNRMLKIEKCLLDVDTLEFHAMPIHIEHENRYEDFRSRGALEFILKLEEFINN